MAKKINYVISSGAEKVEFEAFSDGKAMIQAAVILSESDVRRGKLINIKTGKEYKIVLPRGYKGSCFHGGYRGKAA